MKISIGSSVVAKLNNGNTVSGKIIYLQMTSPSYDDGVLVNDVDSKNDYFFAELDCGNTIRRDQIIRYELT